jgi:putative membrane protein
MIACVVLAAPVVATPLLAQSLGEKTGINSALNIAPATADFVQQVTLSDMFEIQSSQLAMDKVIDEPTKAFARQMVADHTKTSAELKGLIQNGAVKQPAPAVLDSAHQKLLDKLKDLKGQELAKEYRDQQVSAHKDAVSLFERYAKGGDNAALKDWAAKTLPGLQHHLEMAQNLQKQN